MKLRLTPNKMTVRLTMDEWQTLQKIQELNQAFWLSNTKTMMVSLHLADTTSFISTDEGVRVSIDAAGFHQQKTKKDQAWELMVGNNFSISVEVDVMKTPKYIIEI